MDPREQVGSGKGLSVFNIAGSKDKIKNFSLIIDDEMKFQTKEPSNATLALCGQSPHYLVGMLSLDMTGSQWGGVNEGYACTVTQAPGF